MLKLKIITYVIFPQETKEEDIESIATKYSATIESKSTTLPGGKIVTITTYTMIGLFVDTGKIAADCKKINGLITGQKTEPVTE